MPVSAVTLGGTLRTSDGSRIAILGSSLSSTSGYLMWVAESVITAKLVASLPVPLVVGTTIHSGFGAPVTF